jgi:hypothetical protein
MHAKFWPKIVKGRDQFRDLGLSGKIILKWIKKEQGVMVWTGFIWLGIGSSGRIL